MKPCPGYDVKLRPGAGAPFGMKNEEKQQFEIKRGKETQNEILNLKMIIEKKQRTWQ